MAADARVRRIRDRTDVLPVAVFLVLFLLVFREFFFTGRTIFDRDVTLWEIPARRLCAQLIKEGDFALWTDAYGGGQPFLANLKTAALYPAMALYLCLPFFAAFKIYYFIHAVLTWTGVYFLGKSYSLSRRGSFLGASLFVFGGMYLSSFEFYNHVAALAWLPWILILLALPCRRWARRMAALAALWTLSLLAGAPEITLMTLALAALQVVFLAPDRKRRALAAASSFLFALLISAAQILPSLELWRQSGRTATRFSEWSLEAVQLLNLPFAGILGNDRAPGRQVFWAGHFFDRGYPLYYSLYIGLGAIVLAGWALRRLKDRKVMFLGAGAALFFILASGRYSPVHRLFGAVPLVSSIRYPVKFLMGAVFCLCLLAAVGFDRLFESDPPARTAGRRSAAVLAGLGMILALASRPIGGALGRFFDATQAGETSAIRTSLLAAALLAALLAPALSLSRRPGRSRRLGALFIVGLITLDLVYHAREINPLVPVSFFDQPEFAAALDPPFRLFRENDVPGALRRGRSDILRLARYARESDYPLTGIGGGTFYLFDPDTLDIYPREYRKMSEAVEQLSRQDRAKVLRIEGCRYYVSHAGIPGTSFMKLNTSEGALYVHRLADPALAARLVHGQIAAASPEEKLRTCLRADFDPDRQVVVDRPLVLGPAAPAAENESLEIVKISQGAARVRAALSSDGIIVFPGNFARGWRAWIDGRPARVFRANLSSRGVLVPPGRHLIVLRYSPAPFRLGALISILSLIALAGLVVFGRAGQRPGRDEIAPSA